MIISCGDQNKDRIHLYLEDEGNITLKARADGDIWHIAEFLLDSQDRMYMRLFSYLGHGPFAVAGPNNRILTEDEE